MKIKSLLLGSAAAVVAVTGVRAADAVVIPEPELVEYVRVCDTYGTGFFYIPGTETCLQIGGYVRYQIDVQEAFDGGFETAIGTGVLNSGFGETGEIVFFDNGGIGNGILHDSGYETLTRGQLTIDARSETELGTLRGFIALQANRADGDVDADGLDAGFIEIGGLHMGYSDNAFDGGIVGEVDTLGGAKDNRIAYTFTSGSFDATISIDDDDAGVYVGSTVVSTAVEDFTPHVSANAGYDFGMFEARLYGAYDNITDEWAGKAIVGVDVSDAGRLELAAYYTSGFTYVFTDTARLELSNTGVAALNAAFGPLVPPATVAYADVPLYSEWSIQGGYQHQVTEKLALTGTAVYWDNVAHLEDLGGGVSADAWGLGFMVDYEIVENLDMKINIQHIDTDVDILGASDIFDSSTSGFIRFERSF